MATPSDPILYDGSAPVMHKGKPVTQSQAMNALVMKKESKVGRDETLARKLCEMLFVVEINMEGRPQRVIRQPEVAGLPAMATLPIAPGVTRYVMSFGGNGPENS
jgi:hypothetical protein